MYIITTKFIALSVAMFVKLKLNRSQLGYIITDISQFYKWAAVVFLFKPK